MFVSELPKLTLLLIGDSNAIEIGPKNVLLDHEERRNVEEFSSKLCDLCGRHISVINMLGLENLEEFPVNQGNHAFLLLLPYDLHISHYSSRVQQLERDFGKRSLLNVMTVVTHGPGEKFESALADLKAHSGFNEKRFHTCTRCMTDANDIIDLLEKIDVMVSENNCCSEREEQREHLDCKCDKEIRIRHGEILMCITGLIIILKRGFEHFGKKFGNYICSIWVFEGMLYFFLIL